MKVFVHGGAATPLPLLDAMAQRGKEAGLKDVELIHIHTEGPGVVVEPEYDGKQPLFLQHGGKNYLNTYDLRVKCELNGQII